MRSPWERRRRERRLLRETEQRLEDVKNDWDMVREHAGIMAEQKALNHYTAMAAAIFTFPARGRHSS